VRQMEARMTLTPGHLPEEQRKVLRAVALTYRRAKRAGKGQNEAVDAAIRSRNIGG
jgi:hypothetical protein